MHNRVCKAVYCVISVLLGVMVVGIISASGASYNANKSLTSITIDRRDEFNDEGYRIVKGFQPDMDENLDFHNPLQRSPSLTPQEYLKRFGGSEWRILHKIITCESGWNPRAKNVSSTASGLAQFVLQTWLTTRKSMGRVTTPDLRLDPYESIDTMIYLYDHEGTRPWLASKSCWD